MDGMYGLQTEGDDYSDKALMSPDNLMIQPEYHDQYHYHSFNINDHQHRNNIPVFGSEELRFQCSVLSNESAAVDIQNQREAVDEDHDQGQDYSVIKAKIASHPSYPKLLDAYIDCQKFGAPPEIEFLLDEIRREKDLSKQGAVSMCLGVDPELDEFMETYCDILLKYKSDLSRPFDEATSFLNKIETQLGDLCNDDGVLSSDEELMSRGEIEIQDYVQMKSEDRQLKDKLLSRYGGHITSLKLEFSKNKKKGKLPKEARQILFQWWNLHCKWPYPTEADKIALAESTGLDQKQINNWFINQRKRHWKSPENMDSLSAHFLPVD